jgi:major vault protein
VKAYILKPNEALHIRALDDCVDFQGRKRMAGEEWLVRKEGAYLLGVNEQLVSTLQASILTDDMAFVNFS